MGETIWAALGLWLGLNLLLLALFASRAWRTAGSFRHDGLNRLRHGRGRHATAVPKPRRHG